MHWYDWLIIAAVWSLIPAALLLKRRQNREHEQAQRNLEIELQAILLKKSCRVCHAYFPPNVEPNKCGFCGRQVCMWCCDRVAGGAVEEPGGTEVGGTFICRVCTEGAAA